MKEFVEKLIERLEYLQKDKYVLAPTVCYVSEGVKQYINQLAEEYKQQNIDQDLMIVESLPSVYPMMQPFEEEALNRVVERAKYNNGWIPCSERLPENNKVVLCWVVSTTIASGETFMIGSCDRGFWFLQTYEIGHHHFPVKDYEVVAWQPFPEPYRPKGKQVW